jgi:hypothetical protein
MNHDKILQMLESYFPRAFGQSRSFLKHDDAHRMLTRLSQIPRAPLSLTNFNQLLHLNHEAGVTEGFFRYYFLSKPEKHPYAVDRVTSHMPVIHNQGIASPEQLEWGIRRFFFDALLYYGNIRSAYRVLRTHSYNQLNDFFAARRFRSEEMHARGPVLPFESIPVDDRYLISEVACKAYSLGGDDSVTHLEHVLLDAYKKNGGGRLKISSLFDEASALARDQPDQQMMLQLAAEEFMDDEIENEEELLNKVKPIAQRFVLARSSALQNTRLYLSIVNELDVYVATSMRKRVDFRNMARDCEEIFRHDDLQGYKVRYFDPTVSAADGHEDKGLIECLMVKSAKAVLYFAGERDSFGKDAEIAMAMSLGKPVIILCPDTPNGHQREKFFRDIHPLSRLVEFDTGVPIGAMVTCDLRVAAELLSRLFSNRMEYELDQKNGYFRLKERLTGSVVRLQTNWRLLQEAYFNYYHGLS